MFKPYNKVKKKIYGYSECTQKRTAEVYNWILNSDIWKVVYVSR